MAKGGISPVSRYICVLCPIIGQENSCLWQTFFRSFKYSKQSVFDFFHFQYSNIFLYV